MRLFLAFSTLIDFMENAFVSPEYTPELSIVSKTNNCSIEEVLLEKVKQNGEVKRAYGRMFAYDVQVKNGEEEYNTNLISYEENQFHWSEDSLVSGSIKTVMQQEDQVLTVQSENADIQLGDQMTVLVDNSEHIVTVAGIYRTFITDTTTKKLVSCFCGSCLRLSLNYCCDYSFPYYEHN